MRIAIINKLAVLMLAIIRVIALFFVMSYRAMKNSDTFILIAKNGEKCKHMKKRLDRGNSVELTALEKESLPCRPIKSFKDGKLTHYACDNCGQTIVKEENQNGRKN